MKGAKEMNKYDCYWNEHKKQLEIYEHDTNNLCLTISEIFSEKEAQEFFEEFILAYDVK